MKEPWFPEGLRRTGGFLLVLVNELVLSQPINPFWAKDLIVGVPQALNPIVGWPSVPQRLFQARNIYNSSAKHTQVCRMSFLVQEE